MYLGQLGNYIPTHEMKHGLKHFVSILLILRGVSVLKLHCRIPICTYRGADKLQLVFKNMTIKIFNLYCNIVCNTNCLIIIIFIHAIEQIYYLSDLLGDLLLINYSVHTEVGIHSFYFLLRVPW